MAVIVFENATQDQANTFSGATDFLVFSNSSSNALNTTFAPIASGDAISITSNAKSLVFSTAELHNASVNGRVGFNDGSNLITGLNTADVAAPGPGVLAGGAGNDVIYGFGGGDTINTGPGSNYVFGGADGDTITGGTGADHLYGQSPNGGVDGDDNISGDDGNDYLQGNAGADTLDGGLGSDRIVGGNGADTILGGAGNDTVNGNLGDDTIYGGATAAGTPGVGLAGDGSDFLRGGQGNDSIFGGGGNDQLFGDLGDDVLSGGTQADILTGGAGVDVFAFRTAGDAAVDTQTVGSVTTTYYDTITDYLDNTDKISLSFANPAPTPPATTPVAGPAAPNFVYASTANTFANVAQAQVFAQQLLDNDGGTTPPATASTRTFEVAAVSFGADTYLFYNDGGAANSTINSVIKVAGNVATNFTTSDFVA